MELAELAFEEAPIGVVLTENKIIRASNKRFADMLGYDRHALIGQSFRMLYGSAEEFQRVRDVGLGPLSRAEPYVDERMMKRADGAMIWCRFRARTLTPEDPLARVVMSFASIQDSPPQSLSLRERQVLSGLARGLTSKEIARELELSPRTIEDVRARLLRRFEVKNAAELLARMTFIDQ